ncbi:MAG: gliding-motility protein MglA [Myxococcales bacterium]|nr:gliding-motility protein MglA [Myxococcales bacterium]MDH3483428.1 gliding-motility protein MglA [Myxococcales bacterium]
MPLIHHAQREVTLKVVYYGAGLGGKTTNIETLYERTRPEYRGKLVSVHTDAERTLFLDLLPIELGTFRGYSMRLHILSVPGQIAQDSTRQLVLRHVDGVVLVVDSQVAATEGNNFSIRNLDYNLRLYGVDPDRVPLVVQYNKRDLLGIMDFGELRETLGVPEGVSEIEASAREGWGVFETLQAIVRECMHQLGDPGVRPEGHVQCLLPKPRDRFYPRGPVSMIHAIVPDDELEPAQASEG